MSPQQRFSVQKEAHYIIGEKNLHKITDTMFQIFTLSTRLSLFELQDLRLSACIWFEAGRPKCQKHENGLTSRLLPSVTGTTTTTTATTCPTWKVRERGWASMVWRRREPAHDWAATLVLPHLHHPTHHHAGVNIFIPLISTIPLIIMQGWIFSWEKIMFGPLSLPSPAIILFLHTSHS